jgi:hypothetical protein
VEAFTRVLLTAKENEMSGLFDYEQEQSTLKMLDIDPVEELITEIEELEGSPLGPKECQRLIVSYQEAVELMSAMDDPRMTEYLKRMKKWLAKPEFQ